jgi:hypothetical protein
LLEEPLPLDEPPHAASRIAAATPLAMDALRWLGDDPGLLVRISSVWSVATPHARRCLRVPRIFRTTAASCELSHRTSCVGHRASDIRGTSSQLEKRRVTTGWRG